ncbi:uncharacterized protein [Centruroides vittatus]|uniref:uncharacterized protein n=1 Tax=Centruroides vittatus TaxID=120091 RepID=UPI00350EA086
MTYPRYLYFVSLLFTMVVLGGSQTSRPSSLGCSYEPDRLNMMCRNTTLDNIIHSVRILDAAANASIQTKSIEITDSVVPHLPYIFPSFNTSLESLSLTRCRMEFVYPDAFSKLDETLKMLNLSQNKLHAVPYALSVLKNLKVLDLSDNQIVFLRPSPVFDGLINLRELILDRNFLGLSSRHVTDVRHPNFSEPLTNQTRSLASNIGREDFDLGVTVKTLIKLSLRGNKLSKVPDEVFETSFPSLRYIDLSHNLIQALPEFSNHLLPKLEVLLLNSNSIQSVAFYSLPVKLSHLDLSDNPFECDCQALWLYEWHHHGNNTVLLPACQFPKRNRGLHLSSIEQQRLCPEEKNSVRYIHKSTWKYRILATTATSRSIIVTWVVEREGFDSWGLVYRRATDSPYQLILSNDHRIIKHSSEGPKREVVFRDHIEKLDPATTYIICVAITQNEKYLMEPARCHKITTEPSIKQKSPKFAIVLTGISTTERTIAVKWHVITENPTDTPIDAKELVWKLSIRRFATLNVTQMIVKTPFVPRSDKSHEYLVDNLQPGFGYTVCLESGSVVEGRDAINIPSYPIGTVNHKTENVLCKEVTTVAEENLPIAEIAVATTVSTTTTVFVAVIVFFCCPKSIFQCHAKKLKEKLLKKERKSPLEEEDIVSNNLNDDKKVEIEDNIEPNSNLQNLRYFGSTLGSQKKKVTPVGIPQVPSISPPAVPPPSNIPEIPPSVSTPEVLAPQTETQSPADEPTPPATDESSNYTLSPDYEESVQSTEQESNETNEDEGYLTPKTRRKNRKNRVSSFNNGEGYIHPKDIHYLGGRKVQVFVRGSRTLPRKALVQPSSNEPCVFHPRYSLPHAWRRKATQQTEESSNTAALWFKSGSNEDFSSLRMDRKSGRNDPKNPYCIEHV